MSTRTVKERWAFLIVTGLFQRRAFYPGIGWLCFNPTWTRSRHARRDTIATLRNVKVGD